MRFLPLQSKLIAGIGYDPDTHDLVAQFDKDTYYVYNDVPPEIVVQVLFSASHGSTFDRLVKKGDFQFRRVSPDWVFAADARERQKE
jgi:hypothetical protein